MERAGRTGNPTRVAEDAARRAAEEAARRSAELAARATEAPAARQAPLSTDVAGVAGEQAQMAAAGPRGEVPMPAFTGSAAELEGFEGFEGFGPPAAPPPSDGLPATFDAATRDRFIGAELDRLGLAGSQRTQKQNRMLTLFRTADLDGDGVVAGPGERERFVRGLIAGSQADAISQQLQQRFATQASAITAATAEAKAGNVVARGFNSFLNVFNHNMDEMDQARDNAVRLLRNDLPRDLARFNDMVAAAGGDPERIAAAEDYLEGALARAQAAGEEFDRRRGDFGSSNKFWSGLAADVGAGLLVLGGTALAVTGFGAPVGAGLIAAGFAVGGAASVGAHALLDNQYDFRREAAGNFLVGGISAAATVATAGAAAGVTSGLGTRVAGYASSQAVTSGLTSFAQEGAQGFNEGWLGRVAIGTAAGAVVGRAASGVASGVATRLVPQAGSNAVARAGVNIVSGAAAGAAGAGGGALVNEAIGGFDEGWRGRLGQATLGGALSGGVQAAGTELISAGAQRFARRREAQTLQEVYDNYDGPVSREKIEADAAVVGRGLDRDRPLGPVPPGERGSLRDYDFIDARFEEIRARDPQRLQAVHDEAFARAGIDPAAARALIDGYTTSSTAANQQLNQAIEGAVTTVVSGTKPPADFNDTERLVAQMLATRGERMQYVSDALGVPLPDSFRVFRGSPRASSILDAARAIAAGDPALTIQNRAVTSTSLDPATAVDFALAGPRYQETVGSAEGARYRGNHQDYVAYDLDVPAQHALFDKWTDGAASSQGPVHQRIQREVLLVGEAGSQVVDTSRLTISYQGKLYNRDNAAELRAILPQLEADLGSR